MAEVEDKAEAPKRERDDDEAPTEPPTKQQKTSNDETKTEEPSPDKPTAESQGEKTKSESSTDHEEKQEHSAEKEADQPPTTEASQSNQSSEKGGETADESAKNDKSSAPNEKATNDPTTAASAPPTVAAPAPAPASASSSQAVPAGLPTGFGASSTPDPNAILEEKGSVSALFVGRVIGKGGEMIRDLQARSSCRIDVDQNVPQGQPRVITYKGTRRTIDFAKNLVSLLCQENASESDLPLGDAKREFLQVPPTSVGKIIGRGGEMIRELQSRSQAKIQVDHSGHGGHDQQKRVTITGSEQSVVKAKEMILFLVANPMMDAMQSINMLVEDKQHRGGIWGSGPPYVNLQNMGQNMQPNAGGGGYGYDQGSYGGGQQSGYQGGGQQSGYQGGGPPGPGYGQAPYGGGGGGGGPYQQPASQAPYGQYGGGSGGTEMEIFYAAKNFMGRIIGQKGVTINDLQRRSSCDIQINQDVPPGRDCEISIRGSRQGIEMAKQMLREIVETGPNHPYAGGGPPSHMGGYQQNPYGQHGQQQYQQQPAYGQGYNQSYGQGQGGGYNQGHQAPNAYGQRQGGGYQQPPPQYGAPPPAVPQMSAWKSATSPDGQVYYYNEVTGVTQWDKPPGMP